MMNPVQAVFTALRRTFDFQGRAPRSEFWWFMLFNVAVEIAIMIALGFDTSEADRASNVASLVLLLPNLSVQIRRLHDIDRTGRWILLGLIPPAVLVLLYWACLRGTQGENRFAPDPFGEFTAEVFD